MGKGIKEKGDLKLGLRFQPRFEGGAVWAYMARLMTIMTNYYTLTILLLFLTILGL